MTEPQVTEVLVDLRRNVLRFALDLPLPVPNGDYDGMVDIGALGRLLGLEVGDTYLGISDSPEADGGLARSAGVLVRVEEGGRSIVVPRRGDGWEVSFPSGNQCWQRRDATGRLRTLCAVAGDAGRG